MYNTPMLEPGRKRHPLSILVLCSVVVPHTKVLKNGTNEIFVNLSL
jgi:hypothetical protein